jgi:hypothetical protein
VKGVVFGVIYGKSAATLGNDMKKDKVGGIEASIRQVQKEIKELEAQL